VPKSFNSVANRGSFSDVYISIIREIRYHGVDMFSKERLCAIDLVERNVDLGILL
jgi:hypothetical protein